MLRNSSKLDLFGFHKDKQTQCKKGKGQFVAGIGHIFNGVTGDIHQRRIGNIFNQEESIIQECTERIKQGLHKRHTKCDDCQLFTIAFFSRSITLVFQEADA